MGNPAKYRYGRQRVSSADFEHEDTWVAFPPRRLNAGRNDRLSRKPDYVAEPVRAHAPAAPIAPPPPPIVSIVQKPQPLKPDFVNPPPSFEPNEWSVDGRYCRFRRDRGTEISGDSGWGRALSERGRVGFE